MPHKKPVTPLPTAYRLLNPGSVVLLTVGDGQVDNVFALTWNMPVRKDPPMLAILSGKKHFSYPLIEKTGEFGINIFDASQADAVLGCGTLSGHKGVDKFEKFRLTREVAENIKAPLIHEALANLECRVCQVVDLGSSALVLAQVLYAQADERHFRNGMWTFENGLRLLHHLSGPYFCASGESIKAQAAVL